MGGSPAWPTDPAALETAQRELAATEPPAWEPPGRPLRVGGCFACFPRGVVGPGATGDRIWVGAVIMTGRRIVARSVVHEAATAGYTPGLLALRVGAVLEKAVAGLPEPPDVLLVDATGRDHPRRAGLTLQLGAMLDLPTVGVTHRPLVATGEWPSDERGATAPLLLDGQVVGFWLRTRPGTRPLAIHAGWRTTSEQAVQVAMAAVVRHRTPEPLREARRIARAARTRDRRGSR